MSWSLHARWPRMRAHSKIQYPELKMERRAPIRIETRTSKENKTIRRLPKRLKAKMLTNSKLKLKHHKQSKR